MKNHDCLFTTVSLRVILTDLIVISRKPAEPASARDESDRNRHVQFVLFPKDGNTCRAEIPIYCILVTTQEKRVGVFTRRTGKPSIHIICLCNYSKIKYVKLR